MIMGHRNEFRIGEKAAQVVMAIFGIFMIGPLAKYRGIHACDIARGMINAIDLPTEKVFIESDELYRLALKDKKAKPRPSGMI